MKTVTALLRSMSPYSQSRHYDIERLPSETQTDQGHADYYKRTWQANLHVLENGHVFIPPMAFKNIMAESAKFLSIPSKGKATYTKHFESSILVVKPVDTGVHIDEVVPEELFLPSDCTRGSGKRVMKTYPRINNWRGEVEFIVVDHTCLQSFAGDKTKTVFEYVLQQAGSVIGIGRFRPRQNGYYGRFAVESLTITD